jgi:serine/threonine protein kinase
MSVPKQEIITSVDDFEMTKLEDYSFLKLIGNGAYGTVKMGQNQKTLQKVAIKIYPKHKINDAMKKTAVQREIDNLKKLNHPNIVKLYDNF